MGTYVYQKLLKLKIDKVLVVLRQYKTYVDFDKDRQIL